MQLEVEVNKHPNFKVVAKAISSRDGKLMIEHYKPDVIMMDIIMPDDDGVSLINHIYKSYDNYTPYLFVATSISTASMKDMLVELGVDFIRFKPLEYNSLNDVLNGILSDTHRVDKSNIIPKRKKDIADFIAETLSEMKMAKELLGYVCVKTALYFISNDLNTRPPLYNNISAALNLSENSVDKNIRKAISTCVDSELYHSLFGKKSVNNLKFLYEVALYMEKRMRESELR